MLILTEEHIQNNYFMNDAIADLKQGLLSKKEGLIKNPHRTVIEVLDREASVLYMPSADMAQEISSIKVVSIFPENPKQGRPTTQGMLLLTDGKTGEHLCMMNASYLTRLRTGALSGIATERLANKDARTLGVIGTGAMAFEQVLGVLDVRNIEKILLFNRTNKKAIQFKDKLIKFGVTQDIEVMNHVVDVITQSDVICCATRSNNPVFNGKQLKAGMHINGVGSYLPHMREVDFDTIQRASKIVVDDLHGVKEEAGELIHADRETEWSFSDIYAELSELSGSTDLLRESKDEITFFKSVGAAYFDLVVAKGIYYKLKELGIGNNIHI